MTGQRPRRLVAMASLIAGSLLGGTLAGAPPADGQSRPPLQGGVEKRAPETPPRSSRQSDATCGAYDARTEGRSGRLQVMPKAGGGAPISQRPQPTFCMPPDPSWELLGEDGNYCCYFAPSEPLGGHVVVGPGGEGPSGGPPGRGPGFGPGKPGGTPGGSGPPARPGSRPGSTDPGDDRCGPERDPKALQAGLKRGFDECAKAFSGLGYAALALVNPKLILENRNYREAARYLGVQSSDQGLQFLFSEVFYPKTCRDVRTESTCEQNVNDEEAGFRIARRICFWSLPNPIYKALKARPPVRLPPGAPGAPTNPLTEAEVVAALQAAAQLPPHVADAVREGARDLSGVTIQLPPGEGLRLGTVTLGSRIGSGHFKDVYAIEGRPNLTLQIAHHIGEGAESIAREVKGYNLIKDDLLTPALHGFRSAAGGLSYMIRDLLPSDAFITELTPDVRSAIGAVQGRLAAGNRVWVDNHLLNHYVVRNAAGKAIGAGIHDTDMISAASDPAAASELSRLIKPFQTQGRAGIQRLGAYERDACQGKLDAKVFMRDLWQIRYGSAPPF